MPPRRTRLSYPPGTSFLSPSQLLSRLYCVWETKVFNNFLFGLGRRYARIFRFWFSLGVGFGLLAFIISLLILIWQFGWLVIPSAQKNMNLTLPENSRPLITLVLCAGCCLLIILLPVVLHPFYLHGKNLVVVALPSESSLGNHIRPGNVILGVGGLNPESPEDWVSDIQHLSFQDSFGYDGRKDYFIGGNTSVTSDFSGVNTKQGFCVPKENIEDKQQRAIGINCSYGELSFLKIVCLNVTNYEGKKVGASDRGSQAVVNGLVDEHCLKARNVIRYSTCDKRQTPLDLANFCICSENEFCMMPRLQQGEQLVEVTFMDPNSRRCLSQSKEEISGSLAQMHTQAVDHFGAENCHQSLVFVGDPLALAFSLQLTNYQPRRIPFFGLWSISAPLWFPGVLESLILYMFYVSSAVALLNSAPVFYLDGEVILQTCLSCCTPFLHPRRQRQVLHTSLLVGTALFALAVVSGFINLLT